MVKKDPYRFTLAAGFLGYVVQAVVVNFAPLLFVTFQKEFSLSLAQLSFLITLTFAVQLVADILVPKLVRLMGQRPGVVMANGVSVAGLVGLALLPDLFPDPYAGILVAAFFYSLGSAMIEVLISPIVEACPFRHNSRIMSLLHSFYSWGSALTVLLSTVFFLTLGLENWRYLCLLWALVPLCDGILFLKAPLLELEGDEKGHEADFGVFCGKPVFWLLIGVMLLGGASELAVSQWASTFAEQGLGVSKTLGDLLGPLLFALCMGSSRVLYARGTGKLPLEKFMFLSCALCLLSFLLLALSPWPLLGLMACGLAGFSVGIFWPGGLSLGTKKLPGGGTALFAFLACAGDTGCLLGPTAVGFVAELFGGSLKTGFLLSCLFPLGLMAILLLLYRKKPQKA